MPASRPNGFPALSLAALLSGAGLLLSCAASRPAPIAQGPSPTPAQCDLNASPLAGSAPAAPIGQPVSAPALHNVHWLSTKIVSGAAPEGDAAFDELRSMGVKTIITVDGATPDLARAEARGMRYVHIPITYAQANKPQQLELARAVRDLPGPIFIHCHHGKHRGPAAAASAAVLLGLVTPDEGVAFMKTAGTAPNYQGLYACVADARPAAADAIDAAPSDFPAVRKPKGITAAMVDIDEAYEHLGEIASAGWKTPKAHPDLVPVLEAGRLTDLLRVSAEDRKAQALGDDFQKQLASAIARAAALEDGLTGGAPATELDARWKLVVASCKDCHAAHRDRPN